MLDNNDTPNKFTFINFSNGASGHFLARLCLILFGDYDHTQEKRTTYYHMHYDESDFINKSDVLKPNLSRLIELDFFPDIYNKTNEFGCHILDSVKPNEKNFSYFRTNLLSFTGNQFDHYICLMHLKNPDYILNCIKNSKLIQIISDQDDFQQLSFNFVTKLFSVNKKVKKEMVDKWSNALGIKFDDYEDIKKLTWLHWRYNLSYMIEQNSYVPEYLPVLKINFKNITSNSIIPSLISFLEIENPNKVFVTRAEDFMMRYRVSQRKIPFFLSLNEFY